MLIRVLGLFGGVALFMYGMQLMGENFEIVSVSRDTFLSLLAQI